MTRYCKYCNTPFEKGPPIKVFCSRKCKEKYRRKPHVAYKNHNELKCVGCGFVPEHPSQLDVDHIDGDSSNNSPDNLQVLCANCHRLKTHLNKDYLNKKRD